MHKIGITAASALLFAAMAGATPTACPTGTASDYTSTVNSAGGCTEDGLLFSQFNYMPSATGTALALPASAVGISPLLNSGGDGFGFQIVGGFAATSGGESDAIFQYEVSALSSLTSLTGISLSFNGTATGTGIANVSENYCAGGTSVPPTTCGGSLQNLKVQSTQGASSLTASGSLGNVQSVTVSKDIQVNAGTNGTATISSVTNQFQTGSGVTPSSVPEPATLFLIGSGLFGFGVIRKRASRR